ncbi:MAG TPA: hypothetical protein VH370_23275 [Humisphaera sp.]|jgi:hypothetical protein|nr:hypothetical protein [Humisphaera sp.]
MGSGHWSVSTYNDKAVLRARSGTDTFAYSSNAMRSGVLRPHQTLDPSGLQLRESRDSDEHPNSNSVIISLDVTGSMGKVVRGIHADLPRLHELILGHQYLSDPQILFMAVGDATCDQVPLQVGQFESDNRMDQNLENMILEGGGGGQNTESYELAIYIAARHTALDCWDKRQRKGYLFIIGDEMAYQHVSAAQVKRLLGEEIGQDIPLATLIEEASKRFHIYFLIPGGASHGGDKRIVDFWTAQLGASHVIKLDSPEDTSQSIALIIGGNEGVITAGDGVEHLRKRGLVGQTIDRLSAAMGWSKPDGVVNPPRPRRL